MMNTERAIVVSQSQDAGPSPQESSPQESSPLAILQQMHGMLRGRYWLAVLLALMGMAAGGWIGWHTQAPVYQSTGLIRVKPNLPKILYQSDQNGVMPMFDSFVESQVALMKSQRVIDFAMQNPEWKSLNRGLSPEAVLQFTQSMDAAHPRGSELVLVTFNDSDPEAARRGVTATINAYDQLYGENDTDSVQSRVKVLEERRAALTDEYKSLNERVRAIANEVGTSDMDQRYRSQQQQLDKIEAELNEAQLAVALARGSQKAPTTGPAQTAKIETASVEVLATRIPEIQSLLNKRLDLERSLTVQQARLGDQHRSVLEARANLDALSNQIAEMASTYNRLGLGTGNSGGKPLAELQANVENVRELYERVRTETVAMGRRCLEVEALKADADAAKAKLDETLKRIEEVNIESSVGGRIRIESRGDRPLAPLKDKRKQFAAVGSLGMGGLGVGLVLLLGFFDRRVKHIADVHVGPNAAKPILGVLPVLSADLSDPEHALMAAHGVHQIRIALQRRTQPGSHPVFAVTSPSPGAGKTSLTLALGLSYAASGARTLLIDCDFVGGGLTSKMKTETRRRVGHVLRRLGLITTEQLITALKLSKQRRKKMGETLVELGYVTRADVNHALDVQKDAVVGLREVLQGDVAGECMTTTGTPGLFLMPLGSARREHVSQLSYPTLRRMLDVLRGVFDVIIIDTGPALGSLEASVVAMAADQVILTVPRGEQRPLMDRAMEHVTAAGGTIAGIVLNRADPDDIFSSGFSSSVSRESGAEPRRTLVMPSVEHKGMRLGPIGSAVVASSRLTK